jgi:hypothetical protein
MIPMKWTSTSGKLALAMLLQWGALSADPLPVRHPEGLVHGFLVLRALDGEMLAEGDLTQVTRGDRVTSVLAFHFKDGSLHEETVVFSQRRNFRLISYRLVQKGPTFKEPVDMTADSSTGRLTVRYADKDGKEKTATEVRTLPTDLANGMIPVLLKNVAPNMPVVRFSMVAATPKPRLVKLAISRDGDDSFSIAGSRRKATRYDIKVEIGGLSGVVAPLVGKQPPDTHVWILEGSAPAFLKSEGPLFEGGPIWRIELTSPVWPKGESQTGQNGTR